MSISLYRATIPVYLRGLTVMADYIKKARMHCETRGSIRRRSFRQDSRPTCSTSSRRSSE